VTGETNATDPADRADTWPASGWFDGEYDAVVPIEVVLPAGIGITLRLDPRAFLADDDTRHILGQNRQVILFENAEELAAYIADDEEHTLRDRPVWPLVRKLRVDELTPSPVDRHDLVAVAHALADHGTQPPDDVVGRLGDTLDLVADIAEQCELADVEEILDPDSPFWQCAQSRAALADVMRDPDRRMALHEQWQRVLAAVDQAAHWPLAAAPGRGSTGAVSADGKALLEDLEDKALLEDVAPVEALWVGLGEHGAGYTLRERTPTVTDPDTRWLTHNHRVLLAESVEALARWVARDPEADLSSVDGWSDLVGRSGRSAVDYQPYEDNVVDLAEIADQIGPGLDAEDAALVIEGFWFLFGIAHALGYPELATVLDEGGPIGRFVNGTATDIANRQWDAALRLDDADLAAVRADWEHALALLAARCDWGVVRDHPLRGGRSSE
jgi:hypothetical protein